MGCVMMDKHQFIKYQIRSRLPFYLLLIFNGIILLLFAFLFEEAADILHYDNPDFCDHHYGGLGLA